MSTAVSVGGSTQGAGMTTIYQETIHNPLGLHMEEGQPCAGSDWSVFVDRLDDGPTVICLGDEEMSAATALELGRALLEAAQEVQPSRFSGCELMTVTDLATISIRLGISPVDLMAAMDTEADQ